MLTHTNAPTLETLCTRLRQHARQHHTHSVLNVVLSQTLEDEYRVSADIQRSPTHSIGTVTFSTEMQLVEILQAVDGKVDCLLLDIDRRRIFGPQMAALTASELLHTTCLLTYSNGRTWAQGVQDQVARLLKERVVGAKIVIAGDHRRSRLLALKLIDFGADVTVIVREQDEEEEYTAATTVFTQTDYPHDHYIAGEHAAEHIQQAQVLVVWPSWGTWLYPDQAQHVQAGCYVLAVGRGSLDPDGLAIAQERGARLVLADITPRVAGAALAAQLGTKIAPAWGRIAEVPVVAGSAVGEQGAVIVDDVQQPTRIIGVADGSGGLLPDDSHYAERIARVQEAINQQDV